MQTIDQKSYNNMNASEKTRALGFKHYSERELNERAKASEARGTELFKELFKRILAIPELRLSKHLSEKDQETIFASPINDFYQFVTENGYTANDLKNLTENIIAFAYVVKRMENQHNVEATRFNYGFTGENDLGDVAISRLIKLSEAALSTRPDEPVVEDEPDEAIDPQPEPETE